MLASFRGANFDSAQLDAVVRADKVGRDTMLARIVQMVAEAQRSRAPIQRVADQVASWFVPAVIVVAVVAFVVWAVVGPDPRLAHALIEIRQDLITSEAGQMEWADRLAKAVETVLASQQDGDLHTVRFFGSHTDDGPDPQAEDKT